MSPKQTKAVAAQRLEVPERVAGNEAITEREIAERAYFLWQKRGCPYGNPDEDWDRAIDELKHERTRGQRQAS